MMPILSGKDAYNRIKKLAPDIKVLFMSGYSESIDTNREIQEEGLAFIQKPVDSDKLLKILGEVLAGFATNE
jgi:DNA-binding NtrC family response regulator